MAKRKELNEYYRNKFGKDFSSSTLSKWGKEGKIRREILPNKTYDWNFEDFKNIVDSEQYYKKLKARKQKPQDFIGKTKGYLYIKGIVPVEERNQEYLGTMMYCDCLRCGKKNIQVRFTYLSDNGNYHQYGCGCERKERAFLASARKGLTSELLFSYKDDFEKFLFIHKALVGNTDKYYTTCAIEEYIQTIDYFYNNEQFNQLYLFLGKNKKENTFYDWGKPSLDHIIPKSKGGGHNKENLQFLTVFENLAKRNMTWAEWENFKEKTHITSDYFIENIITKKGGVDYE